MFVERKQKNIPVLLCVEFACLFFRTAGSILKFYKVFLWYSKKRNYIHMYFGKTLDTFLSMLSALRSLRFGIAKVYMHDKCRNFGTNMSMETPKKLH